MLMRTMKPEVAGPTHGTRRLRREEQSEGDQVREERKAGRHHEGPSRPCMIEILF